ncbi:hypothetical protein SCLCIDRAFT_1023804 [Scleroderma citrinum Foug A]|uniref:BTB domain-containing protein n=1 Tax=Scleroderma citrinum Foug A TaxID=1036808 RepID=A0A0C2ZBQ6_9AGAM|nr:hypothetical protein SCLCIDRAFT_1023804 [Scleroderma citrinum Foug A]
MCNTRSNQLALPLPSLCHPFQKLRHIYIMEKNIQEKDDEFYMTFVTLNVEDCLFRVPRCTLESQSQIFRDMFSLPVPKSEPLEGSTNENPLFLPGIEAQEFRLLLGVLFTSAFGPQKNLPKSPDEWLSVIKLARMWEFDDIHKSSVKMVPYHSVKKSPVEKVALAFQHDIKEWLVPGLDELAKRPEPIGIGDVDLLGLDVALKVNRVVG